MEKGVNAGVVCLNFNKNIMRIVSLKIKNYRAYEGEHLVEFDKQFTSFIGKNDTGKSTIFDALDIFFGNKKPDLDDLCISVPDKVIEFTCIFSDLPTSIEIDTSAKTDLSEEYLLNTDGNLEIKKVYKCTEKTIPSSPEVYIVANYPSTEQVPFLHSYNQKSLKELGEKKVLSVNDARMNHLWRKAVWQNINGLQLVITDLKIEDFDAKAKRIYSKIEDFMPLFFAFRADREMTDSDAEAKDPMQLAVAEAQQLYQAEIDSIKEKIQEKVEEVAQLALKKLHDIDPNLASKLNPVLKSKPTWKFDYKIEDDRGVALNKRGSGTRRLVLFNFFRAQAEKKSTESKKGIIYAIEEPETSQHPDNQKLIISALSELSKDTNRQVIITTHSPELLRDIKDSHSQGIRFIQTDSSDIREIETGNDALILSANALGILGKQIFGSAEKIILVEGKNDCLFLEHTANTMKNAGEITNDLSGSKIEVLPVGGCTGVKNWIEMNKHKKLGLKTFVFLDSDRENNSPTKTKNESFVDSLAAENQIEKAFCTKKREIENYIKKELTGCEFGDYDDVKAIVPKVTNVAKNKLIDYYWTQMTVNDIDEEIKKIVCDIIAQ